MMVQLTQKQIIRFLKNQPIAAPSDCWLWEGNCDRCGYGKFSVNGHYIGAHRIAYFLEHGNIPKNLEVMHACDNPRCVNPAHLNLGSHKENMHDCIKRNRFNRPSGKAWQKAHAGKQARGERAGAARLTEKAVLEILKAFKNGKTRQELAKQYNVSWTTVNFIVKRKSWRHVSGA